MNFDILNEQGVTEILLALLENEEISIGELLGKISVSRWRFSILKPQLIASGLVTETRGEMNRKNLRLTEKGKLVAQKLLEIKKILET